MHQTIILFNLFLQLIKLTEKNQLKLSILLMAKNVRVQGIPVSIYYSENTKKRAENFVRYCFFKNDEVLHKGDCILKKWAKRIWHKFLKRKR